jgi:hypothetical protein
MQVIGGSIMKRIMKGFALFSFFTILAIAGSAHAQLMIGAVDPLNGFPVSVADASGTQLTLCLDDPVNCDPGPGVSPFTKEIGFSEAAYYSAVARIRSGTGVKGTVEFSVMAGFAGEPEADGGQVVVNKKVIQFTGLPVSGKYRVLHPYGEDVYTVTVNQRTGTGSIMKTVKTIGTQADSFQGAGLGPVKFFLNQPSAPAGFIGTDLQEPVSGSPVRNFVRLIGPPGSNLGGKRAPNVLTQGLFDMEGKMLAQ